MVFPRLHAHKKWNWEWNMGLLTSRLFLLTSATSDMGVSSHESNVPSLDIREIKTHMCAHSHITFIKHPLIYLDIFTFMLQASPL